MIRSILEAINEGHQTFDQFKRAMATAGWKFEQEPQDFSDYWVWSDPLGFMNAFVWLDTVDHDTVTTIFLHPIEDSKKTDSQSELFRAEPGRASNLVRMKIVPPTSSRMLKDYRWLLDRAGL